MVDSSETQMVPLQGRGALGVIAVEEQVAREEREHRPDRAPARRPALVDDLGQIMGNPALAQGTGERLLLARFGVEAPPTTVAIVPGAVLLPKSAGVHLRLGG